jgi:hypothetical protein
MREEASRDEINAQAPVSRLLILYNPSAIAIVGSKSGRRSEEYRQLVYICNVIILGYF